MPESVESVVLPALLVRVVPELVGMLVVPVVEMLVLDLVGMQVLAELVLALALRVPSLL